MYKYFMLDAEQPSSGAGDARRQLPMLGTPGLGSLQKGERWWGACVKDLLA